MIRSWLVVATRRDIVVRALKYAMVVGAVLIAINHGNAIVANEVSTGRLLQMLLTTLVPYCVSTASSVGATMAANERDASPP